MEKQILNKKQPKSISPVVPLMIALGGIVLAAGVMAVIGHFTSKNDDPNGSSAAPNDGPSDETTTKTNLAAGLGKSSGSEVFRCRSKTYPLQYGTCHPDVMVLQRQLKRLGADLGITGKFKDGVDGEFGAITRSAAQKYINKEIFNPQDMLTIRKQFQSA